MQCKGGMKESSDSLRGVGMFDAQAGHDLRSDAQIRDEIEQTIRQMLRVQRVDPAKFPVKVTVHQGVVELEGQLPDRGTRRLIVETSGEIPSVERVDCSRLLPSSLLD